jgi:streptomycin 6-kinase
MIRPQDIEVPGALEAAQVRYRGHEGRAWVAGLPGLAVELLARWQLRLDGSPRCGAVALVLPVRTAGDLPAALKLQQVDGETAGEPAALRAWDGHGSVRLLDHDPPTGTMLLERLDHTRTLSSIADDERALAILSGLLARLVSVPAPPGIRRLQQVAEQMLKRTPEAIARLAGADSRRLARCCAAAVASVLPVTGDRLLHWDLHYDNVLAGDREPWLAIDPKPLAGDSGFELLPALWNRWDDVTASGDVERAVRRRFDLMTEVLGVDRQRAAAWTLGRVLQETLWDVAGGASTIAPAPAAIARALLPRADLHLTRAGAD